MDPGARDDFGTMRHRSPTKVMTFLKASKATTNTLVPITSTICPGVKYLPWAALTIVKSTVTAILTDYARGVEDLFLAFGLFSVLALLPCHPI